MKCTYPNRSQIIEAYLDKKLSGQELEDFTAHYYGCDDCFEELQLFAKTRQLIAEEGKEIFADSVIKQQELKQKAYTRPFEIRKPGYGWIFAPLAVAALMIWLILPTKPAGEAFQPNPAMEDRIKNPVWRSALQLEVISPTNSLVAKDQIEFRWHSNARSAIYWTLVNNKEEAIVLRAATQNNQYSFTDVGKKLTPGLYYWKLESDRELLYVGKFVVPE